MYVMSLLAFRVYKLKLKCKHILKGSYLPAVYYKSENGYTGKHCGVVYHSSPLMSSTALNKHNYVEKL